VNTLRSFLCMLVAAMPAAAGEPGALVTDVSGEVAPAVQLFSEVETGTELTLGQGARLTLENYASCEAATLTGGSVVVGEIGLDLARADVAGRVEMPCAQAVTLRTEVAGAGIVLRGAGPPNVPLSPQIVVAGGGAGFDSMRVMRDGRTVWTVPVRAGRVEWPEGRLFLTDGGTYLLVLDGPAGEHHARVVADRYVDGRTVLRP
jgi:hypothetical protein